MSEPHTSLISRLESQRIIYEINIINLSLSLETDLNHDRTTTNLLKLHSEENLINRDIKYTSHLMLAVGQRLLVIL